MIRHLPGPAGRLEALVDDPAAACTTATARKPGEVVPPPRAAVVVGHPHPLYGGTMHNKVVFQAAKAFCRLGCAVVRFNFRGVGTSEGGFADGRGEADDFAAVLEYAAARHPGVELWTAGVSFGAWVALTAGAADPRVTLLVGIAPPIAQYDFSAVRGSGKPKFFIQGERDEICPLRDLQLFYAQAAEPKELVVIDAADHLFDGHVSEVADAVDDLLADWPGRRPRRAGGGSR